MTSERVENFDLWHFFDIVNAEEKTAKCLFCSNIYSYKTTIGNLRAHLERRHPDRFVNVETLMETLDMEDGVAEIEAVDMEYEGPSEEVNKKRKSLQIDVPKVSVWDYFTKIVDDGSKRLARCSICEHDYSYASTTSNLKCHLRRRHKELCIVEEGEGEGEGEGEDGNGGGSDDNYEPPVKRERIRLSGKRVNHSPLWKFFTKLESDSDDLSAMCHICCGVYKYKSTTGNLTCHLDKKHPAQYRRLLKLRESYNKGDSDISDNDIHSGEDRDDDQNNEKAEEGSPEPEPKYDSLWRAFRRTSGGATCRLCGDNVKTARGARRAHLLQRHPKIVGVEEVQSGASSPRNPLQDVEDQVLIERLRDSPPPSPLRHRGSPPPQRHRGSPPPQRHRGSPPPLRHRGSSRFPKKPSGGEREKRVEDVVRDDRTDDSEVSSFTSYVGALLRSLPRTMRSKLQLDVVSLIMKKKIEYEQGEDKSNEGAKQVSSPGLLEQFGVCMHVQKPSATPNPPKYIITLPPQSQGVNGEALKEFLITNGDKMNSDGNQEVVEVTETNETEETTRNGDISRR